MNSNTEKTQSSGRRFKVKATGEVGAAVSPNGMGSVIHRLATVGSANNVQLVDLLDEKTGEVRTYRFSALEEI